MTTLQIHAKADKDGIAHVDIPLGGPGSEADVIITVPGTDDIPRTYDFSSLAGRLQWRGDAVSMQRELRDEW